VLGKSAFRAIEVKQGDLLLFSSFLVHRSGENTTDRIRWSCHFRYNNLADPTYVARKYHHNYIYRPNNELRTSGFPTQADIEGVFGSQPTESSDE
jgi:phytanoyl-CoA hydroxylase